MHHSVFPDAASAFLQLMGTWCELAMPATMPIHCTEKGTVVTLTLLQNESQKIGTEQDHQFLLYRCVYRGS